MSREEIARIIRTKRQEKGWTLIRLAKEANVSREIVGKIEKNKHAPGLDILIRILDALDLEICVRSK